MSLQKITISSYNSHGQSLLVIRTYRWREKTASLQYDDEDGGNGFYTSNGESDEHQTMGAPSPLI